MRMLRGTRAGLLALTPLVLLAVIAGAGDLSFTATTHANVGPVCHACGRPITGEYVTAEGRAYHPEHFVCDLCGEPIKGRYVKDGWGNLYHASHDGKAPACAYCGRFISPALTGGGTRYPDGRQVCALCRKTAVDSETEAADLMGEVGRRLSLEGMRIPTDEIDLHLVDLDDLKRRAGGSGHTLRGWTSYEQSEGLMRGSLSRTIEVYILEGMPREDAAATLAHELAHVWQMVHQRLNNDPSFAEGSSNYASYLVLRRYRSGQSDFIVKNMLRSKDRIYGEGFRRVKRYADAKGNAAWLNRLESQDRLPPGY